MTGNTSNGLNDKVVLVTGGGTGIGRAIVDQFVAAGARVFITGRREEPLKSTAEARVAWATGDVAKSGESKRIVGEVLSKWGRLDVLVNNAGAGVMGPLVETNDEGIDLCLSVNLGGMLRFSREALSPLAQTKGQIINISSTVANVAMAGAVAYGASKAAVDHATRSLAAEVGPMGVRVNAVQPGPTETDMLNSAMTDEMKQMYIQQTPMGRLGTPNDIAGAVVLLASDKAGWVTGQVIASSGGAMI